MESILMKYLPPLALFLACAQVLFGDSLILTMVPASGYANSGGTVEVALVALNPAATDARFAPPARLAGKLIQGETTYAVELVGGKPESTVIHAGAFARHTYTFKMPFAASGLAYLEVTDADATPIRAVIVAHASTGAPQAKAQALTAGPAQSGSAIASIDRSFWNRFGAHEAIYFVFGDRDPAAKFQLSFKYRLRGFGTGDAAHAVRALQFGYTQRSLWDITGNSSPFYDTSYMPSLFYESFEPAPTGTGNPVTWLGYQTGYQHESNGGADSASRSLNTLFFRRGLMFGRADQWHLIVSPRVAAYIGGLSDNPDLAEYRGYLEWMVAIGKGSGPTLTYTGRAGNSANHFSSQFDLTIPVRSQFLDFATYLTLQYFNGYGESLRAYDEHSESLRIGFSLVRLR